MTDQTRPMDAERSTVSYLRVIGENECRKCVHTKHVGRCDHKTEVKWWDGKEFGTTYFECDCKWDENLSEEESDGR